MAEVRMLPSSRVERASAPELKRVLPPYQYIIVMLSNNKTEAQITEQLMDLIGDHYGALL
jgi:hypothetical protein